MAKNNEIKFHSSNYDSIGLTESMHNTLINSLIEIQYEPIDWPGQENNEHSHCTIYIRVPPENIADPEFYVISYHVLDDDNGPYRLYSAWTLEQAILIRNEIRTTFPKAATSQIANTKKLLSGSRNNKTQPNDKH